MKRFTQIEVAARFGVNPATVWRWHENGCPRPTTRLLHRRGKPLVYTLEDIAAIEVWYKNRQAEVGDE